MARERTLDDKLGIARTQYKFSGQQSETTDRMIRYMLNRLTACFKWSGLPDTIPVEHLERYLLTYGNCFITDIDGSLYALIGAPGGVLDAYYEPSRYIVANPALKLSADYDIKNDGVWAWNDSDRMGIFWLLRYYLSLVAEADVSMHVALINSRIPAIVNAGNEEQAQAAKEFFNVIRRGDLSALMGKDWAKTLSTLPYSTAGATDQLVPIIELRQHVWATMLTELGIPAVSNGKREALNSSETETATGILRPLIDDMLTHRQRTCELLNAKYGLDASVELGSIWAEVEAESESIVEEVVDDGSNEDP